MPTIDPPSPLRFEDDDLADDREVDSVLLSQFYQRLFPFRQIFQWLNHSPAPSTDFSHREIAFTLDQGQYVRYQSYATADSFKKDVLKLNPSRFEIGPVYSANPRDRKMIAKSAFKPISKEMVFDIDLTDYDPIRTCCSDKDICNRCWKFITVAINIMDEALREDFGFEHVLWVYSGRRGAHAWVCDRRARELDDSSRRAVASYLQIIGKGERGKLVNLRRPFHPHVSRSFDILKRTFGRSILEEQDPWRTPESTEKLLKLIPDKELATALRRKWEDADVSSTQKWKDIDVVAKHGTIKKLDAGALLESKQDIIIEYMYPRLDIEVSRHMIHLLKSPFCVHPGTGRVCVPIDPAHADSFDPFDVPTASQLLQELRRYDSQERDDSHGRVQDYERTSLKKHVEYFASFVQSLLKSEAKAKREREEYQVDLSF
jgi:DNA primase small subunit